MFAAIIVVCHAAIGGCNYMTDGAGPLDKVACEASIQSADKGLREKYEGATFAGECVPLDANGKLSTTDLAAVKARLDKAVK